MHDLLLTGMWLQEESDHEVIEETNVIKKRRLSIPPSPSRSASTLTSGDLADISSSSLSNKASSGPSSLERATSSLELSHPAVLPSAITSRGSGEHLYVTGRAASSQELSRQPYCQPSPLEVQVSECPAWESYVQSGTVLTALLSAISSRGSGECPAWGELCAVWNCPNSLTFSHHL